jgi:hypothetical protein
MKVRVRFEGGPGIVARLISAVDQIGASPTSLSAQFQDESSCEVVISDGALAHRFAHKIQSLWGVLDVSVLAADAQGDLSHDGAAEKCAEEDQEPN